MEPIIAVMLILGCDHSMMVCRQSAEPVQQYASVEACEADTDMRLRFVDYPVAVAQCIEAPGLSEGEKIAIDWRIDAVGGLIAEAYAGEEAPVIVADAGAN
jgi:hypothetical protein